MDNFFDKSISTSNAAILKYLLKNVKGAQYAIENVTERGRVCHFENVTLAL
jgi:hypothetical protein